MMIYFTKSFKKGKEKQQTLGLICDRGMFCILSLNCTDIT